MEKIMKKQTLKNRNGMFKKINKAAINITA